MKENSKMTLIQTNFYFKAELTIVQKKPRLFIRQDFLIFFTNLKWGEKLGKTVSTLLTFTIQYFILGFLRVFYRLTSIIMKLLILAIRSIKENFL